MINCENCGAPMVPVDGRNYLMCGYCQTFHFPTQLKDSADRITPLFERGEVDCPVCCKPLAVGALDEVRMRYCDQCRGVLIPNEAFAEVVRDRRRGYSGPDQSPVPLDSRQYERHLDCPSCSRRMEVHPYHGPGSVVIDSCAACHLIWLDHGELAAIERAPGRRQPVAVPSYQPSIQPVESKRGTDDRRVNLLDILFG